MTITVAPEIEQHAVGEIAQRVGRLYSLPAVANEVIELTRDPHVDNVKLKECIERDPALTVRVLRVVNSSLFRLNGGVADLNQALAMLGVKPLKMLVLGFRTLPEALFLNVAREQLDWYWRSTLIRAVAAREIAETLFEQSGDEAFLAGLLQDIGVLALLGQLGQPYAEAVGLVIDERADLQAVERESLGFDHTQLTSRLLDSWNMPHVLVKAIGEPKILQRLGRSVEPHARLAQVLHLAELMAQLVAQCRLSVLPDLLEAGREYAEMDKQSLDALVRALDPKVRQLADVFSLPIEPEADFLEILTKAHQRLSDMTDSLLVQGRGTSFSEVHPAESLSTPPRDLRTVVQDYLASPESPPASAEPAHNETDRPNAASRDGSTDTLLLSRMFGDSEKLQRRLATAVGQARASRGSLSVVMLAVQGVEEFAPAHLNLASQLLRAASRRALGGDEQTEQITDTQLVWILQDRERREAVALANGAISQVRVAVGQLQDAGRFAECITAAGVASVDTPMKNFLPGSLLEAASRCLLAAFTGSGTVKSLVVS